jgi:hypothetical protein
MFLRVKHHLQEELLVALPELSEVEAPRFQDVRHMKMLRLSAVHTGRLYPPGNIPGTHFC